MSPVKRSPFLRVTLRLLASVLVLWTPRPGFALGRVAEVGDLRMFYEVFGEENEGPPLLLLHGGTSNIELSYSLQIAFFSGHRRVLAVEQMGHGRTADLPGRPFSYRQMADDTAQLLHQLEWPAVDVIGFSDGANIGLQLALRHPERVRKVAVSGATSSPAVMDSATVEWLRAADADDWPADIREAYARLSPDGAEHWPVALERMKKMWLEFEPFSPQDLARIKAPALLIGGDSDVPVEHVTEMFRAIPRARLLILPGTGHETFQSRSEWLHPILQEFFAEPMPSE